ncbi:MAG: galactokinase [Saprospiraceae bacterium]|nr:galactokinase [Saprospiraceae bacterium]
MIEQTTISNFHQIFGTKPDLVVRAPGRINLIGEHTDYNGGFVLPAAIDKAIWLAMGRRNDDELHFHSLDLHDSYRGEVGTFQKSEKNWANYLLGVISEAQKDGLKIGGVNVVFGGDIPIGAGMSSSAALESGMLAGLNELYDLKLQKLDIVKLAQRGENRFVGMNCGIMDMFASMMGRADHVLRLDCRSLDFEHFPFHAPDFALVLCNSGVKHSLVNSEYNTRRAECEAGVRYFQAFLPEAKTLRDVPLDLVLGEKERLPVHVFQRCKFVVEEIGRVGAACNALKTSDFATFGQLMYATHEGLRHEYEVTCPETDFLVDEARGHAAVLGARQMGGGFGGCTLNLVRAAAVEGFVAQMTDAYRLQFGLKLVCHNVKITDGVGVIQVADFR